MPYEREHFHDSSAIFGFSLGASDAPLSMIKVDLSFTGWFSPILMRVATPMRSLAVLRWCWTLLVEFEERILRERKQLAPARDPGWGQLFSLKTLFSNFVPKQAWTVSLASSQFSPMISENFELSLVLNAEPTANSTNNLCCLLRPGSTVAVVNLFGSRKPTSKGPSSEDTLLKPMTDAGLLQYLPTVRMAAVCGYHRRLILNVV